MKKTTLDQLKSYGTMSAAFLAAAPLASDAAPVYSDPADITITQSVDGNSRIYIDIDGGTISTSFFAVADVSVNAWYYNNPTWGGNSAGAWANNSNRIANFSGVASSSASFFALNSPIGPSSVFNTNWSSGGVLAAYWSGASYGIWKPGPITGYIGVELQLGGNPHYGWVQLTVDAGGVPGTPSSVTVHDFAYESIPNTAIAAGDVGVAPIPTVSEWGLITLSLFLLSFGMVYVGRRQSVLSGEMSGEDAFDIKANFQAPPVEWSVLKKTLLATALLAMIAGLTTFGIYGSIAMVDVVGTAIAGPIFAYLMHLMMIYKKEN